MKKILFLFYGIEPSSDCDKKSTFFFGVLEILITFALGIEKFKHHAYDIEEN